MINECVLLPRHYKLTLLHATYHDFFMCGMESSTTHIYAPSLLVTLNSRHRAKTFGGTFLLCCSINLHDIPNALVVSVEIVNTPSVL
jgi:hypothetical protein